MVGGVWDPDKMDGALPAYNAEKEQESADLRDDAFDQKDADHVAKETVKEEVAGSGESLDEATAKHQKEDEAFGEISDTLPDGIDLRNPTPADISKAERMGTPQGVLLSYLDFRIFGQ